MQFGQPVRSATEDANAGNIEPPALRTTPRDKAIERGPKRNEFVGIGSTPDKGLSGALSKALGDKAIATRQRKEQEARARTGLETAISEQDQKLKRADWASTLFGQNPSYAAAQQQAVRNGINQAYMELASTIDNYATTHPDEFRQKVMGDLLTGITEKYKDPETVSNATEAWLQKVEPLVAKQYEAWYGNSLLEQFNQAKRGVGLKADYFNFELASALEGGSERRLGELYNEAVDYFQGSERPEGMSDVAWRRSINETMQEHLRKGNIQFYQLAKQVGYVDTMNEGEQKQLQQAISHYDTQFKRQVNTLKNAYWEQIYDTDLDDFDEAIRLTQQFQQELDAMEHRSSGTAGAQEALWGANMDAARFRRQFRKEAERALEGVARRESDAMRLQELQAAEAGKADDRADARMRLGASIQEVRAATDANLLTTVEDFTGADAGTLDLGDAARRILSDVDLAEAVAADWRRTDSTSDLVNTVTKAFMGGWMKWAQEDGTLSEEGLRAYDAIHMLDRDRKFRASVGNDLHDRWLLLKDGIENGKPVDSIQRDMERFEQNQGKLSEWATSESWPYDKSEMNRRQYIQELIQPLVGNVHEGEISAALERYQRGLVMWNGDHRAAAEYLRNTIGSDSINVFGSVINNPMNLKEFSVQTTDVDGNPKEATYDLQTIFNRAGSMGMLQPYVALLLNKDPNEVGGNLSGVTGLRVRTVNNFDGLEFDSPGSPFPMRISANQLQIWANKIADEDRKERERKYNMSEEQIREVRRSLRERRTGRMRVE